MENWEHVLTTFTLPGFDGIPVYEVVIFFIQEIKKNSLPMRSKSIAFSFFLAMFPALMFIFTLIPFLGIESLNEKNISEFLKTVVPSGEIYNIIFDTLNGALVKKRGDLLTFSFFLSGYLATDGVLAMMASFDKSYEDYTKRSSLNARLVATKIALLLILMFLLSVVLIVVGQQIFRYGFGILNIDNFITRFVINFVKYFVIVLLFFFSISLIYYYGPSTRRKYRFISPGATVATILSLLASYGFSVYIKHFNSYNTIFGSIGTIMLLMVWFNINAFVLLIGYELNASIYYHKKNKRFSAVNTSRLPTTS
ncbi:MAG: YihY/virulence factor BrkB family protein [Chitinophagales bacterium]|nr:YihY/virulence factor BrkB family protein [Chitinophagales bacterium]